MYILVKNLNSRLIFVMNDEVQFNILLDELKSLLKQSFFKKEDYYPKAFFDFQCRILKEDEILANGMNLRKILFLKFVPLLLCLSY